MRKRYVGSSIARASLAAGSVVALGLGLSVGAGCGSSFATGGDAADAAGGPGADASAEASFDATVEAATDADTASTTDASADGSPGDGGSTSAVETVASALVHPRGLAYENGKLYIAEKGNSRLLQCEAASCVPVSFAASQQGIDAVAANGSTLAWLTHDADGSGDSINVVTDGSTVQTKRYTEGAPLVSLQASGQASQGVLVVGAGSTDAPDEIYATGDTLGNLFGVSPAAFPSFAVIGSRVVGVHANSSLALTDVTPLGAGQVVDVANSFCQPCTVTAAAASATTAFFAVTHEARDGVAQPPSIVTWLASDTTSTAKYPTTLTADQIDDVQAMIVVEPYLYIAQAVTPETDDAGVPIGTGTRISRCKYADGCDAPLRPQVYEWGNALQGITTDGQSVYLSFDDGASGEVVRLAPP